MDTEQVVVNGENVVVSGESVTIEYQQQTEYSDNELLMQINDNIVSGIGLISALLGMIIGFCCAKELLKLWLA